MVRPICSKRRNSSQVAQSPTKLEFANNTRGAHSCVRNTPTGLPDCTNIVSSGFMVRMVRNMASYASQLRAARPVPPYTTRSSGRSATSGSRLFCNIRYGASICQLAHDNSVPRGAITGRGPDIRLLVSPICAYRGNMACARSTSGAIAE